MLPNDWVGKGESCDDDSSLIFRSSGQKAVPGVVDEQSSSAITNGPTLERSLVANSLASFRSTIFSSTVACGVPLILFGLL